MLTAIALLGLRPVPAGAQTTGELKRMSLQQLMEVDVSTLSRVPARAVELPAAIHVITSDDIRRSGAMSLPEALRMAPGVQVARIDSARYAIGMRGFADRLSRAILVMIDGRAVYSPLFAGTYWEVQDTLLEDVERIEVIRGPGGTLWGANAVNGIINIITKPASETQGAAAAVGGGTQTDGVVSGRFGGARGDRFHYRAYGKGVWRDPELPPDGVEYDSWRLAQAGFRADWTLPESRAFTLQGDVYSARLGSRYTAPVFNPPSSEVSLYEAPLAGGNLLARWSGPAAFGGHFQVQAFYDRTTRDERPIGETRDTVDLDFQHQFRRGRHGLVWGGGYRLSRGAITAIAPSAIVPPTRTDNLFSAFLQDDVTLVPERLRASLGAKVEHNDYSGTEVQPSARLQLALSPGHHVFAAITRAVRTPSRVETDYTTASLANPAVPAFVRLVPNPEFQPEELVAYEAGYKLQPAPTLYATVSGFFNHLDNVLSTDLLTPTIEATPPPPRLILPVSFGNGLHGNSHGVEITADWRTFSWLRTTTAYSFARIQLTKDPGSTDVSQERRGEGLTPHHQAELQLSVDAPHGIQVDWMWSYVSRLEAGPVPPYASVNARVAWQVAPQFELALVGNDLFHERHLEWADAREIRRAALLSLTWRPPRRRN